VPCKNGVRWSPPRVLGCDPRPGIVPIPGANTDCVSPLPNYIPYMLHDIPCGECSRDFRAAAWVPAVFAVADVSSLSGQSPFSQKSPACYSDGARRRAKCQFVPATFFSLSRFFRRIISNRPPTFAAMSRVLLRVPSVDRPRPQKATVTCIPSLIETPRAVRRQATHRVVFEGSDRYVCPGCNVFFRLHFLELYRSTFPVGRWRTGPC